MSLKHNIPKGKQLVLFDGVCNLCNTSVQQIIKFDKYHRFLFAPLQGEIGKYITKKYNIDIVKIDSILLYNPRENKVYNKSSAALRIIRLLKFPINVLCIGYVIPRFLRNYIYDFIAKNRYKWYGKKENCMIPTSDLKEKFLY